MFYEPDKGNHGLKYDPYKSIVVPRPIGWISSINKEGRVNLAPFSQFNNLGYEPPYVMFAASNFPWAARPKDSVTNVIETGEFVVNMATWELREAVNITGSAVEPGVDEASLAGLVMEKSELVAPLRVAASPVHLECKYHAMLALPGRNLEQSHYVVVGRVIGVHIRDDVLTPEGKLDILKIRPIARLGYHDYTSIDSIFTMAPTGPRVDLRNAGLAGKPVPPRAAE
jgi:flavin reductase (DIM6/NTAB) family NADH-FMN oxidoreductase RutF